MERLTPDTRLIRNVKQINDAIEKYGNRYLRDKDITFSQGSLALFVQEQVEDSISLKALEEHQNLSQPTIYGLTSRLEKRGLLESFFAHEEVRMKKVRLTPLGHQRVESFQGCVDAIEEHVLHVLTEEERETLLNLLMKVNQSLRES